jgi:EAL domain-containing protein (putative c-di-GMP-specific phosphodiesterase class I)
VRAVLDPNELPLGRWVLREACRQARAWQDAGLPPLPVAVNVSAVEFRDKGFVESVRTILSDLKQLVVAEGIETQRQRVYLQSQRCAQGQGYLFSRPLAAAQFNNRRPLRIRHLTYGRAAILR